jgi:hypothetical protein
MRSTAAGLAACPEAWHCNMHSSRAVADQATAPLASCSDVAAQNDLSFGATPSQPGAGAAS